MKRTVAQSRDEPIGVRQRDAGDEGSKRPGPAGHPDQVAALVLVGT